MLTIWHDWLPASPSTTAASWGCTVGAAQSLVHLYVSNPFTVLTPKTCDIAWYVWFWVPTVSCHLAINHHVDHLAWPTSGPPLENGCSVGVHCRRIVELSAPLCFESFCGVNTQDMPHRVVYLVLGPGRVLLSSHQPSCWPFGMTDFRPAPRERLRCGGALSAHRRAVCTFMFRILLRCWHPRHATSRGIFGFGSQGVLPSGHQPSCWPFGMTDFRLPPWKRLRRGGALSVQRRAVCTFMFWILLRCWHPRHAGSRGIFGFGSRRCFAIWPSTIMLTIWHDRLPASPSKTAAVWGCTVGIA